MYCTRECSLVSYSYLVILFATVAAPATHKRTYTVTHTYIHILYVNMFVNRVLLISHLTETVRFNFQTTSDRMGCDKMRWD